MSNVRYLDERRPLLRFKVWKILYRAHPNYPAVRVPDCLPPKFMGHVELIRTELEAAETAAWLLFDRASARRAGPPGEYVAFGARVPEASPKNYTPEEIRFFLKEEKA